MYEVLATAQHGVCAMCAKPCSTGWRLAVDHAHQTGCARALPHPRGQVIAASLVLD
ncbi:endonuclease domain-containing protein [Nonomuraea sp. 3N208]|uniref:endonuclease domain-containing protein n=1 Tax=Nonomuraea sp. 3N208 TaxID=3457421 RepID=UPI003FCF3445